MRIGELWADEDRPTIDGDWIRGILVLGRQSRNPVDTDGSKRGTSRVTRKFNVICESQALYGKFDGTQAHIGPHKYDGSYPEDALMGTFHNPISTPKGVRMDLQCRKIGEAYHPQCAALRDNIEHNRPFGGFSPLFDGNSDMSTGEVQTVDAVCSIDWVPNPGSVRSIVESEAVAYDAAHELGELGAKHEQLKKEHEELREKHEDLVAKHEEHEKQIGECRTMIGECHSRIGESEAAIAELKESRKEKEEEPAKEEEKKADEADEKPAKIAESRAGGARTEPIPVVTSASGSVVVTDLYKFIREGK